MADVNLDRVLSRIDTHEDARNKKEVGELKTIGEKLDLLNMTLLDIDTNLGRIAHSLNRISEAVSSIDIDHIQLRTWGMDSDASATAPSSDWQCNSSDESFYAWGCTFPPKEEEAESDCAGH